MMGLELKLLKLKASDEYHWTSSRARIAGFRFALDKIFLEISSFFGEKYSLWKNELLTPDDLIFDLTQKLPQYFL